jgi:cell envelope opacity-associated protein A
VAITYTSTSAVKPGMTSYKNGVLTIRFPKRAERGNVKQIPINTESRDQQAKGKASRPAIQSWSVARRATMSQVFRGHGATVVR